MPKITAYLELVDNMSNRFAKIEAATRKAAAAAEMLETAHASSAGARSVDVMTQRLEVQEAMLERQGAVAEELRTKHEMLASTYGIEAVNTQKVHNEMVKAQMAEMKICEAADRTAAQIERQRMQSIAATQALEQANRAQEEMTAKAVVMGDTYGQSMNEISAQLAQLSGYAQTMDLEIFKASEIERYSNQLEKVQAQFANTKRSQEALSGVASMGDMSQINAAMKAYDSNMQKLIASTQRAESATDSLRAAEWQRVEILEKAKRATEEAYAQKCYEDTKKRIMEMQNANKRNTGEIEASTRAQRQYTDAVAGSTAGVNGLLNKAKGLVAAYVGIQGLKGGMGASDTYVTNSARIGMINDSLQTQAQLQENIYQAAQRSKTGYNGMVASVAKLNMLAGKSFASNNEAIQFTELMNKAFKASGASAQESASAMYQITQAMAAGRLQGDEFKSIMENAPMLAQAIANYTGVGMEGLKELSSQGKLSSDIIKNSLFMAGDDIEAMFAKMPMTFAEAGILIKNHATNTFSGVFEKMNALLNSERGQQAISGIMVSIDMLAIGISGLIDAASTVSDFFVNNWSIIEPIVLGIASAVGIYTAALLIHNTVQGISNGLKTLAAISAVAHGTATATEAAATCGMTAAQLSFNAALLACPLTWILLGIIAIITIIYAATAAFNKFSGESVSATGIIAGAFNVLKAGIINTFIVPVWNKFVMFANFLGNAFINPVAAVKVLFYDMAQDVIKRVIEIAKAIETVINKIPGVEVSITAGLDSLYNGLETASQKVKEESAWKEYVKKMDYMDYSAAAKAGYTAGQNLENKVKDMFAKDGSTQSTEKDGYASTSLTLDGIGNDTKKISNSMEATEEDLKWLKDIAERDIINRFTTATLAPQFKVEIANVNENADVDGISDKFARDFMELINIAAEGV